jgi:acetylornithine deacetylase/succinyl-diaminopimelate desuccinylase-like protein
MSKSETEARVLAQAETALPEARARLEAFLRIPSISTQPAHAKDCKAAAEWSAAHLTASGMTATVHATPGHPIVVGHHPGPGGNAPHILYYGHYDVVPADPLELWTTTPFEPTWVDGPHGQRLVCRGAVDDKGQSMMWMEALRAWHDAAGGPPCQVTVLLEGEEEIGSPNLEPFLHANKAALSADVAVIADTNMWDIDTPGIGTRLRGMLYVQIDLEGPVRDLHSGLFGGIAMNPANALATALGRLKDDTGRITIPGFYDGVNEVSAAQKQAWKDLGFNEPRLLADLGLSVPGGEQGRHALERIWSRPTADINGMWSGYTGEGAKTIIPSLAHAKVSFRLVGQQDPGKIFEALKLWLKAQLPADAKLTVTALSQAIPIEIPSDSRFVQAAMAAMTAEYGKPAQFIGSGGSIPVVASFRSILGVDSVMAGFGLEDDQVHSPNEKFEWRCFVGGLKSHARMLAGFAKG